MASKISSFKITRGSMKSVDKAMAHAGAVDFIKRKRFDKAVKKHEDILTHQWIMTNNDYKSKVKGGVVPEDIFREAQEALKESLYKATEKVFGKTFETRQEERKDFIRQEQIKLYTVFREKLTPGTLIKTKARIPVQFNLSHSNLKEVEIGYVEPGCVMMFLDTPPDSEDKVLEIPMSRWLAEERVVFAALLEEDVEILKPNEESSKQ